MAVGESLTIRNYTLFEQVVSRVIQKEENDPASVFNAGPLPGFLANIYENMGPWNRSEQIRWEVIGVQGNAKAVSPNERMAQGGITKRHIVPLQGVELAGETQTVLPSDYMYGLTEADVSRRIARPLLDWNKTVFQEVTMDVATQGAYNNSGTPVEGFAFDVVDLHGNTVQKAKVSVSATQVPDTLANSTESAFLYPTRTGTETAADHVIDAGGDWTTALAANYRDLLTVRPGNSTRIRGYVGTDVAATIRTTMKSELGAVESRREFIDLAIRNAGGLGEAFPIVFGLEGVDYFYAPDLPADLGIFVPEGKRPFYFSRGMRGVDGQSISTGVWTETMNPETRGTQYGYREWTNAGVSDKTGAVVVDFRA
jgi:hypothetical protein